MPESSNYSNNSQTVVFGVDEFDFETIEHQNGHATVVRFRINNPAIKAGDMVVVLQESEIHFHGMIHSIDEGGQALASDRRGSLLPATVQ